MQIIPSKNEFAQTYSAGANTLLYTQSSADLNTSVALMLKLTSAGKNAFMLESVTGGDVKGRYSIIGMDPDLIWTCEGPASFVQRDGEDSPKHACDGNPLDALRGILAASKIDLPDSLPPMAAGLFGYLGYDMIRQVEHLPNVNEDRLGVEDAIMIRPRLIAIIDNVKDELTFVAPTYYNASISPDQAYRDAQARLLEAEALLNTTLPEGAGTPSAPVGEPVSNTSKADYFALIEKAKDYIRAGDIFQVVPSQRWTLDFDLPPFALYRALRRTNPSPYMFYFNFGDFQVIGASPEILVQVKDKTVTIRPIAGTRPRGKDAQQDLALEADLMADKKELAEHLMLLDLGRNDVGRVAKIGTVNPTEKFIIERYSHVMHIVSNVEGELADDQDAISALLAGLPAGTVSGAPKVRAMEIIDELEVEKRGIYGGGVGYFSANGDMDICIALRTAVVKDRSLYIQAGGGVVYDSDPEAEYQETVNKSKALRTAAQLAPNYLSGLKN